MAMGKSARATVVVNVFGGPGCGKTAMAWEICERLRREGFLVEYAPEYAKELTWDASSKAATELERSHARELLDGRPDHQMAIVREQHRRISRCIGQVDFVVTDGPLVQTLAYMRGADSKSPDIRRLYAKVREQTVELARLYPTFDLLAKRSGARDYPQAGTDYTRDQALAVDRTVRALLDELCPRAGSYMSCGLDFAVRNMASVLWGARAASRSTARDAGMEAVERAATRAPGSPADRDEPDAARQR